MPLMSCPECAKEVSDKAPSCPNCGVPIASAIETQAAGAQLTTVQETSKKLKLHTLFSVGLIFLGIIWMFGAMAEGGAEPSTLSVVLPPFLIIAGFVWFIVTRFKIWWHHK